MAAVTDLSWAQLAEGMSQVMGITIGVATYSENPNNSGSGTVTFAVQDLRNVKSYFQNPSSGVIKAIFGIIAAARVAQDSVNQGKATGEKLNAFPAPTTGTPSNGQVPITYTIAAKALLSSATQVVGTNV